MSAVTLRICLSLLAATSLLLTASSVLAQDVAQQVAETPPRVDIAVIQGLIHKDLRPLAPGYLEWMRRRLETAGLTVASGSVSRIPDDELKQRPDATTTPTRLQHGARASAGRTLLVDLDRRDDGLSLGLRLYDTAGGQMLAGRLTETTAITLATDANRALQPIPPLLGYPADSLDEPSSVTLDELAGLGRALAAFGRGELASAWREIAKSSVVGAQQLRNEIAAAAAQPDSAPSERARLLATQGDPGAAWSLIARAAPAELEKQDPDPKLLQAAGEVLLARGRLAEAKRYFRKALAVNPRSPEVALSLAEVLEGQKKPGEARSMWERAAALDRSSPVAVSLLAMSETDPVRKAKLLMSTGGREARRLNPGRAQLYFNRAARTDPALAGDAQDRTGQLYEQLGEVHAARDSYQGAIDQSGVTGSRLHAIARVQQTIGEYEAAQANYMRALDMIGDESQVLTDLGGLYTESGQVQQAVQTLERASSLQPQNPLVQRSLARALNLRNDREDRKRAALLMISASEHAPPSAEDLMDLAALQRETGDLGAARQSLEQAVTLRPLSTTAHQDLATVLKESGDTAAAQAAIAQVEILGAATAGPTGSSEAQGDERPEATPSDRFVGLVQSFVTPQEQGAAKQVVLLGLQTLPPQSWGARLRAWTRPRKLDLGSLEYELADAIAMHHQLVTGNLLDPSIPGSVAELARFDSEGSLDPDIIASLNETLGTDAVFIARAIPRSGEESTASGCTSEDALEIELRMLSGVKSFEVKALSNKACVAAEVIPKGALRWQTGLLAVCLLLLLVAPVARGWGGVVVDFKLPPRTKALFAVSLKRRPRKPNDKSILKSGPTSWLVQKRLQSLNRYERRLDGKRIIFRWIPARRKAYYLTVRGPLLDYTSEQIIGDFLEEKTVKVRRGKAIKVDFDMSPSEAAIEIRVTVGGVMVRQAQACLRGVPGSLRYASEGAAFLYAGTGDHVLVAADGGRLAEQPLRVETLEPIRIAIDLENENELLFRDCPAAVDAYMAGDFRTAADVLEQAGQEQAAHRIRALWHHTQGDRTAEARALAASGQLVESAEILASGSDAAEAAALFEHAGEHKRAAEAYQSAGNLVAAARNFESAYDYENAADCYRDLGDTEKVLELLEATGDYFEAARTASEVQQIDRAISNYQQVDGRHPHYSEACRDMAGLLAARGHVDLAIEKYNEAIELGGDETVPLETLLAFGQLLESSGHAAEALEIYERVRRRDLNYSNVSTRINALKEDATRMAGTTAGPGGLITAATAPGAPEEERYELLDELGRGGMGVVYKARDKHLGRLVAMKFLPDNLQQHPTAVKLFLREARATAALNHPNIVTMYDAAQQGGRYFISMECLEGVALDAVLKKRGPLSEKLLAQLGMQVCAGLDYAHRNRIVHRDIKPSNLFVTKERVLKIMDFGLAKAIEEVRRNSTMIGGTPNFMAPEQAAGEPVDQRTDLYSLGATFFQLLTGTVPFEDGDVTYHHRHTQPPDARERLATVTAEFAELLLQLMAKAPEERVQSAAEVGGRLKGIFEST